MVWWGRTNGTTESSEIFFWDGTNTTQITHNAYEDDDPQISGQSVAWDGKTNGLSSGNEIFFAEPDSDAETVDTSGCIFRFY